MWKWALALDSARSHNPTTPFIACAKNIASRSVFLSSYSQTTRPSLGIDGCVISPYGKQASLHVFSTAYMEFTYCSNITCVSMCKCYRARQMQGLKSTRLGKGLQAQVQNNSVRGCNCADGILGAGIQWNYPNITVTHNCIHSGGSFSVYVAVVYASVK